MPEWRPQVLDVVAGVLLAGFSFGVTPAAANGEAQQQVWLNVPGFVVAVLLLVTRRRWPLPVFAVSVAATVLAVLAPWPRPVAVLTGLICAYTVATEMRRVVAWLSGLVASAVVYLVLPSRSWLDAVAIFALAGLAVAIGDVVRTRRAYLAELRERVRRAEHAREDETRRRVIEERLRIARELHDVVAHNIAMINVQAGVAQHVLRARPDQAEESLTHVRKASRAVLDEMSTVLGVLREGDGVEEPVRGLDHLPELIDQAAGVGLRVDHRRDGTPRPLPAAVDLAAYRIIQESLTNAHKHAPDDHVRLRLVFTGDALEIIIDNRTEGKAPGTGFGLAGMRERAVALGGRLSAGATTGGHFLVHARLPA